jgi:hypothetical protein
MKAVLARTNRKTTLTPLPDGADRARTPGARQVIRAPTSSRYAGDHRLPKTIGLACVQAELNISVLEHMPFCIAVGDESAETGHHECLRRIGVDEAPDRIGRRVGAARLLTLGPGVECTARKHRLKRPFRRSISVGDHQRLSIGARRPPE